MYSLGVNTISIPEGKVLKMYANTITEGIVMVRGDSQNMRLSAMFSGYAYGAVRNTINIIDYGSHIHIYIDDTAKTTYYISASGTGDYIAGVLSLTRNLDFTILETLPSGITEITSS